MVDHGRKLANADALSNDTMRALLNAAANAASPEETRRDVAERHRRGIYAGKILLEVVKRQRTGQAAAAKGAVMRDLTKGYLGRAATNSKVINEKVWPPFRCVSHFWATHLFYRERGHLAFPCALDRLPMFVAIAEDFRRIGETTKSHPKAPHTILTANEMAQLPAQLALPGGRLRFELSP